jgi:hypothetical protein
MSLTFPASPSNNQVYTDTTTGKSWVYNSSLSSWKSASAMSYDVAAGSPGLPAASQILGQIVFIRKVLFAGNFANSQWTCSVAPTNAVTLNILQNGTSIGSVLFAANATTATFQTTSGNPVLFNVGDVMQIVAPNTQDITFTDPSGSFYGLLQ